jgi:hypothetical protein
MTDISDDISDDIVNFFIDTLSRLDDLLYNTNNLNNDVNISGIKRYMRNFLLRNCKHEPITDFIDIDYEQTQHITYCKKCMLNL